MGIFDDIKESISNFFKKMTTKYEKSNKRKKPKIWVGLHGKEILIK